MKITALALALIALGIALAVLLPGVYGEALIVGGFVVLVYKMVRFADSDASERQAAMDARADEVRSSHQRPI